MSMRADQMVSPDRAGHWMQTSRGREFYPVDPRADEVHIDDIAAALSKQCRYAGHCKRFYSVAEHSVLVASRAPEHLKLTALMHDASEAYLVDVPRPIKPNLPNYSIIENRLMHVIAEKYGFAWPMPPEVHDLDNRILLAERDQNLLPSPRSWGLEGLEPLDVKLKFLNPEQAEFLFLAMFEAYTKSPMFGGSLLCV